MTDPAYSSEILDYDAIVAHQARQHQEVSAPIGMPAASKVSEAMIDAVLALPWWKRTLIYYGFVDPRSIVA